jgi:TPR repeat protein
MRSFAGTMICASLLAAAAWDFASADPSRAHASVQHPKTYASAAPALTVAAERGNARAQSRLAYMYWVGRGVPKNYVVAAWWARRAAEQGEPAAQYLLGLL